MGLKTEEELKYLHSPIWARLDDKTALKALDELCDQALLAHDLQDRINRVLGMKPDNREEEWTDADDLLEEIQAILRGEKDD
ncbi:hypothetical protein GWO43_16135 [candidate division KSB1 bacterium]|nr:hypothetical protein [candidate division KSB1 bacterium]NIV68763.1 hypothetical protein [Phycisphaerae bacterium]NIS25480.1 hypothetical protein [candidate division KSB1 bacterium]NIT72373.1 hypothetical protein [candidate division KSB1 bacterium]NIU26157.1 hypothetical protein [candidate division KSB1 bacterium]